MLVFGGVSGEGEVSYVWHRYGTTDASDHESELYSQTAGTPNDLLLLQIWEACSSCVFQSYLQKIHFQTLSASLLKGHVSTMLIKVYFLEVVQCID